MWSCEDFVVFIKLIILNAEKKIGIATKGDYWGGGGS